MFHWPPPPPRQKLLDTAERIFAARRRGHTITKQTASESHHAGHLLRISSAAFSFPASREPNSPQCLSSLHSVPVVKSHRHRSALGPERTRKLHCLKYAACRSRCSTLHKAAQWASFCFSQIQFLLATAVTAEGVITLEATLVQTAAAAEIVALFFQIHQSLGERKTLLPQGRHQTVPVPFFRGGLPFAHNLGKFPLMPQPVPIIAAMI